PQAPTNIRLERSKKRGLLATWDDNNECLKRQGPRYGVYVYDETNRLVYEIYVAEKSAFLGGLDVCSPYWVRISTIGIEGVSSASARIKTFDPP
ncbi:hypothetical protein T265_16050, partial [Opisthorchis viverrini]